MGNKQLTPPKEKAPIKTAKKVVSIVPRSNPGSSLKTNSLPYQNARPYVLNIIKNTVPKLIPVVNPFLIPTALAVSKFSSYLSKKRSVTDDLNKFITNISITC